MSRKGNRRAQVVIVRKHKRLGLGHVVAFAATGGMSAPLTAAKGVTNARYNARTRRLQEQSADYGD
jgi:hypothetical protein